MQDCRLIVDPPAAGAWNMAVDEVLLADAIEHGNATLRFYEWNEPTLSLGYFQQYDDRVQHHASRQSAIVRRQSGGGAILHHHELTYSIALPAAHPLAGQADVLYSAVHNAAIESLQPLIDDTSPGAKLVVICEDSGIAPADEPFLCFQRRARGDVLLLPDENLSGHSPFIWKIVGSAQRRRQGAILQHGSILLQKSPAAPELAGLNDQTGTRLSAAGLAAKLQDGLAAALQMRLQESNLPDRLSAAAADLESRKYGVPAWTKRR